MNKILIGSILCLLITSGCSQLKKNPPAKGFNADSSDAKAIAIADSVMQAMGGRQNWDQTKIIQWTFFGMRSHTWNKKTGRDSIWIPDKKLAIDMNINSKKGTVIKEGKKITQKDSLKKYLKKGYQIWVNDSYWLVMPFKLKDSGVTLNYKGIAKMESGVPAYKLQLTFDNVGVTPDNKFWVYVDTTDNMVRQWTYFPKAEKDKKGFVLPWKNYKKHGKIMLSGDRGKHKLTNIKVIDHWPKNSENR